MTQLNEHVADRIAQRVSREQNWKVSARQVMQIADDSDARAFSVNEIDLPSDIVDAVKAEIKEYGF